MIRFAHLEELADLKGIWRQCFEDEDPYIDSYYEEAGTFARHLVYCDPNLKQPVSMLDLLPFTIALEGEKLQAFYIYAAATLPSFQGRGIMHTLIGESCRIAEEEGKDYIALIPQTQTLIDFYQKQQFLIPLYKKMETFCVPSDEENSSFSEITSCPETEFISLKKRYEGRFPAAVLHDDPFLRLIYRQTLAGGGSILKLGQENYAVCYLQKEKLFVQEISCPDSELKGALCRLGRYFKKETGIVQRHGKDQLYGLIRPLAEKASKNLSDVYMNTMLD